MRWRHSSLFYLEQWTAFFLGIACLAVFLWALLGGQQAFSSGHHSPFLQQTISTVGWLLTIAVALLGTALTRFAFYTPPNETRDVKEPLEENQLAAGSAKADSSLSKPVATDQGRS